MIIYICYTACAVCILFGRIHTFTISFEDVSFSLCIEDAVVVQYFFLLGDLYLINKSKMFVFFIMMNQSCSCGTILLFLLGNLYLIIQI